MKINLNSMDKVWGKLCFRAEVCKTKMTEIKQFYEISIFFFYHTLFINTLLTFDRFGTHSTGSVSRVQN